MKKIYLMALGLLAGYAQAQTPVLNGPNVSSQAIKYREVIEASPVRTSSGTGLTHKTLGKKSFATKIGETQNDQQTNASIYRRVQLLPDGKVSATWTTSADAAPYVTRGSGYNHFNGTAWGPATALRIESERCGFPNYVYNPTTNEEIITSHKVLSSGVAGGIIMSRKTGVGSGTWTSSTVLDTTATIPGVLWVQTAVSGDYLIAIGSYTDSSSTQPNRVNKGGVRTPQVYSRYQFSTNTWLVKNDLLPGYDNSRYYSGGGDNYSIDANGTNVAIIIGGLTDDLALYKSTDAGATWTKTIIDSFPVAAYDYKQLVDTSDTNDGSVHVSIDNNGVAHCFWARSRVLDNNLEDESISFFPGQNAILYWSDNTPIESAKVIGGMPDANNNGELDLAGSWRDATARYGNHSLATMPYAAIDNNGNIYCIFSALTEDDISTDNKNFRDIYIVYSKDGGATWSNIKNLTDWLGLNVEQVFGSASKKMDGRLHLTFLQKGSIGRYSETNPGAAGTHEIVYMVVDTADIFGDLVGLNKVTNNELFTVGQNFPNPSNGNTAIPVNFKSTTSVNVTVVDLLGKVVYAQSFENVSAGNSQLNLNMGSINPGVYVYSVEAAGFKTSRRMIIE
ncbi:MAG: T9SS type A sorting domain-containing protein [Bacteroidota bacterium]|nr:T9SS type A sorting domain-containing protein [Bacteroidota bacterium]